MKTYKFTYDSFPEINEQISLCLGFFDGVHLGHQKIINEAKKLGNKVGVLSFSNSVYNHLNKTCELVTPSLFKEKILKDMGVDYYFEIEMSKNLINCSKTKFIKNLKLLNPKVCLCGTDYTFGKGRAGTIVDLQKNFEIKIVDFVDFEGEKIGTRRIFKAIKSGDMFLAKEMLGRNYLVSGKVIEGLHNGAKLGFPTANIELKDFVLPREGVYFGYAIIDDKKYPSFASFGTHPTIDKLDCPILEVHIFDFNKDLYDEDIGFEFIQFTRENHHFYSEFDLIEQLNSDKKDAKEFFNKKNL